MVTIAILELVTFHRGDDPHGGAGENLNVEISSTRVGAKTMSK
jgi:hypothetical protein